MRHCFCLRETPELTAALGEVRPLPTESVPCTQALGRVLGGDVQTPLSWPPFPRSTRDGFAVRAVDTATATALTPVALRCTGTSPVGGVPAGVLHTGETWRVVTGSALPEGADAVVMQEDAALEGAGLGALCRVFTPIAPGEHIMAAGHDLRWGDGLACGGYPLRAHTVALLAQFLTHIPVRRRPVLGILATGDEFCHAQPDTPMEQASPLPSNAILLECLGKTHGAQVVQLGTVPDVADALRERLLHALEDQLAPCDVLVVFGGSSGGPRDCTARAIASLPGCRLYGRDQIVSTGRPLTLARAGHTWLWGLPGHAMGLSLAAHVFLVPMLRRLAGMAEATGNGSSRMARLAHALPAQSMVTEHYPVALTSRGGCPTAWPVRGGTGRLALLRDLSGWISLRGGARKGLRQGAAVRVHLFS